jgi:hypothetical protein
MKHLVFCLFLLTASSASAQKILLLPDDDAAGSTALATALTGAGLTVTKAGVPSYQYNGGNPATAGFDVIVILAGTPTAANTDMPVAGQTAIANFVAAGGGLVNTEWAALHVANGQWATLKPLVLLSRTSGTTGTLDYTVAQGFAMHPLWAGLPAMFTFPSATNVGAMIPGPGVVRVASSMAAGDGVVARDLLNSGRIVEVSTAGNFVPNTWTDANLQKLMVNACTWASLSRMNFPPVAKPGGPYNVPEGGTVQLSGMCPDPDMDAQLLQWDFSHNGAYMVADATGPMPTFSAANLAGPKTVTIALKCTDSGGLSNVATATVNVSDVPPTFTSMPPLNATEGTTYNYQATLTDPGFGQTITCTLAKGPMGMSVSGNTCKVVWLPTYNQALAGTAAVDVLATDSGGASTHQTWTITVAFLDTCNNGLPDTWQITYFGMLCADPAGDPDMDGRPNLKEFQDGTDPTQYDGPSAPMLSLPMDGDRVSAMPTLVVLNAIEPHGEPLTYEFWTFPTAQLGNSVDIEIGVMPGMMSTSATVQNPLLEDHHYWWRARARDPYTYGPWSMTGTFFVDAIHEPPGAPGISMPADQAHIATEMPTLVVTDAKNPDERVLTYTFELYGDANMMMPVESKPMIAETPGTTSYAVMTKLTDYMRYYWRVKATDDQGLDGAWSPLVSFLITPGTPPPTDPTMLTPADGSIVPTHTPMVQVGGSVDPQQEPLTYQCDLDVKETFDTPQKQSVTGLVPDNMDVATWSPMTLTEDQRYCVRCRARSNAGTSGWKQSCFTINAQNNAPSVPVLTNPSDGGMAAGGVVRFTWVDSIDPEGDNLRYEIELASDAKFAKRVGEATGESGRTGVAIEGVMAGSYYWHARAVDASGAASAWSKANMFTVADLQTPSLKPPPAAGGCACAVGAKRPGAGGAILALLFMLVLSRRWRTKR